jgi:hypothetical protein
LPVVDTIQDWAVLVGPNDDRMIVDDVTADRLAYDIWVDDQTMLGIVRSSRGGSRETLRFPIDLMVQEAFFVSDGLVFSLTSQTDESRFEIRYWRDGAAESTVVWQATAEHPQYSEIAVRRDHLLFFVTTNDVTCLVEMDPRVPERRTDLACGAEGEELWWLKASADDTVSYLVNDPFSEDPACGRLYRVLVDATEPVETANTGCVARGVADSRFAAWTTAPVPDSSGTVDWFHVPLFVLVDDHIENLGIGTAGSATICSDGVYWTTEEGLYSPQEIRHWAPGRPIGVVFRSSRSGRFDDYTLSAPVCVPQGVGFHRVDHRLNGDLPTEFVTHPAMGWHDPLPMTLDMQ